MRCAFLIPLLISLSACVGPADKVAARVTIDLAEPARKQLTNDFQRLENTSILETGKDANAVFGEVVLNRSTLIHWLNERVRTIVAWDYAPFSRLLDGDLPNHIQVLSSNHRYENSELPDSIAGGAQSVGLAENAGTTLYLIGKLSKQLFGVRLPESEDFVPVVSPRIGIVALSSNLFDDWMNEKVRFQDKSLTGGVDSLLASEYRLGTLFHEARHTDGNGKSMGFLHAICPMGHDLAGRPSCDRARNGAYAVHGSYFKLAARDCRDCSVKEREVLNLFALDAFDRVLESAEFWDATPEGVQ